MRKWKCIKTYDEKKWSVGKTYTTEEDGKGLIADDGDGNGWNEPWNFCGDYFEEIKDFTLADLKPCMVVVRRDGCVRTVIGTKIGMCLVGKDGYYFEMSSISNDLKYNGKDRNFDIVKVYDICNSMADSQEINIKNRELLWERIEKSPKQIKLEELETKQREIADEMAKLRKEME